MGTELVPAGIARTKALWEIDEQLQSLMDRAQEEEAAPCPGCEGKKWIATPTGSITCPECAGKGTGVISVATTDALVAYFEAAAQKIDRIAEFLKTKKLLEQARKDEKARLDERGRVEANSFKRAERMLQDFMEARGITQIKGKLNTLTLCNNSQASLQINEPAKVPVQLQRVQITVTREWWDRFVELRKEPEQWTLAVDDLVRAMRDVSNPMIDETAVREKLVAGEIVNGCDLIFGKHLRMR